MAVPYYIAGLLVLLVAPVTLSQSCTALDQDGTCQGESAAALHQISLHRALDCSVCDVDFSTPEDSNAGLETFLTLPAGLKTKFKNACTVAGETLDMVLTTESNWTTKLKHDKVVGTMSQTNVKSGTSVAWDFQLVSLPLVNQSWLTMSSSVYSTWIQVAQSFSKSKLTVSLPLQPELEYVKLNQVFLNQPQTEMNLTIRHLPWSLLLLKKTVCFP